MLPQQDEGTAAVRSYRRRDVALAFLAAIATIGFAWTGFQSSAWLRHRFSEADKVTELNEEALATSAQADSVQSRDTILYVEWVGVLEAGDEDTADAVYQLFRESVKDYIENAETVVNGIPLVPPFEDEDYDVNRQREEARELVEAADRHAAATDRASEMGARYGGIGVIFAAVLASTGVATRFDRPGIRRGFISVGGGLVTIAVVLLFFTPVEFV
jgi:hypothetical protein